MSSPSQNKRVLVVDDKDAEIIGVVLERLGGYRVDCADNAQDALALASRVPFDLFLLDGSMPGMDGFTLAKALRDEGTKSPIIFVTAHMNEVTRPHAQAVGACEVIEKPFDSEQLVEAARRAIDGDCEDVVTATATM